MEKTHFLELEDSSIIPYTISEGKKFEKLPSGVYIHRIYKCAPMEYCSRFSKLEDLDSLIKFKGSLIDKVVNIADEFFSTKTQEAYKELKIAYKMGILLYGPPGTGKTCTVRLIMKSLAEKYNAVCLDFTGSDPRMIKMGVDAVRRHQDNPILVFFDEMEQSTNGAFEGEWLSYLDGTDSIQNTIFIGCTNKIEQIPDRIKNRKSRIKHCLEIKNLPYEVYKEYITDRLPAMSPAMIAKFAYQASDNNLTIDQLKNAIMDYRLEGFSIAKAIKIAKTIVDDKTPSTLEDYYFKEDEEEEDDDDNGPTPD